MQESIVRKKKQPQKVKPVNQRKSSNRLQPVEAPVEPFHIMLPLTLKYKEGKDDKVCYFQCQEHLDKYISRYKLKPNTYTVTKTQPKVKAKDIFDLLDEIS